MKSPNGQPLLRGHMPRELANRAELSRFCRHIRVEFLVGTSKPRMSTVYLDAQR